jgi:hypothetical protein
MLRGAIESLGLPLPPRDAILASNSILADKNAVRSAVGGSGSVRQALSTLGLSTAGKNYDRLLTACAAHGISPPAKWRVKRWDHDQVTLTTVGIAKRTRWTCLGDANAVRTAVRESRTWSQAALRFWSSPGAADIRALKAVARPLNIAPTGAHFHQPVLRDRAAVEAAVAQSESITDVLSALGLSQDARRALVGACRKYGLALRRGDPAEMARRSHERGKRTYRWGRPEDVLFEGSGATQKAVRRMVLRYDLLPYRCAECLGDPEWRGKPLTLTLDHVNGNPTDHRIDNLRFLCPNCDSQTTTFGARNSRRSRNAHRATSAVAGREPKPS